MASRAPDYSTEVRRLLDAGRLVMGRCGTETRPRVADIVAEAGLSNDAFYRHFSSKDALVSAILEDGTLRLRSYLDHQMAKEATSEGKVRRWVEGILAQARDEDVAGTTLAVWWNSGGLTGDPETSRAPLAELLHAPFAELGSRQPEIDATLATHATIGILTDHLWRRERPSRATVKHVVAFCVSAVRP